MPRVPRSTRTLPAVRSPQAATGSFHGPAMAVLIERGDLALARSRLLQRECQKLARLFNVTHFWEGVLPS